MAEQRQYTLIMITICLKLNATIWGGDIQTTISLWLNISNANLDQTSYIFTYGVDANNFFGIFSIPSVLKARLTIGGVDSFQQEIGTGATNHNWTNIVIRQNATHAAVFMNATQTMAVANTDWFKNLPANDKYIRFQAMPENDMFKPIVIDELRIFNTSLTDKQIKELYYYGQPPQLYVYNKINISTSSPAHEAILTRKDIKINATVNSTYNFNCSLWLNDTLNISDQTYTAGKDNKVGFNITAPTGWHRYKLSCTSRGNQTNTSYQDFKISPFNPLITFNPYEYSGVNYTRNMNYSINVSQCPSNATVRIYINNVLNITDTLTCTAKADINNYSYMHGSEGYYNISVWVNTTTFIDSTADYYIKNQTFKSDLYSPRVESINLTIPGGFANASGVFSLRCVDNVTPYLHYNITHNATDLYNGNLTNGTIQAIPGTIYQGINYLTGYCADFFDFTTETTSYNINRKEIHLIDERLNAAFDYSNVSTLRLYYDDNSSYYDFKGNATTKVNFTSIGNAKLRLEIIYTDLSLIPRYLDTSLSDTNSLRVCVNTDDITHYEQIILSATETPVSVRNIFSDCIIAEDYTRFVYQDNLILKAYTINKIYYLYIWDDDTKIYLASMDGSLATYYNVDVLEFNKQAYNINIGGEIISFHKVNNNLHIYYENLDNDSIETTMTITQVNNSRVWFTATETSNPNEFNLIWDYSTLNLDNNTLYKLQVDTEKTDGTTSSNLRYFDTNANSGKMQGGLAIAISVLLMIFGLSMAISRIALGWFGLIVSIAAIAVTTLAVSSMYIILLQVIETIILIYIGLLMVNQNYGALT